MGSEGALGAGTSLGYEVTGDCDGSAAGAGAKSQGEWCPGIGVRFERRLSWLSEDEERWGEKGGFLIWWIVKERLEW